MDNAEIKLVMAAINDEPELPDEIPPAMWLAMKNICKENDREAMEEVLRITVRLTKDGIRNRFQEAIRYA